MTLSYIHCNIYPSPLIRLAAVCAVLIGLFAIPQTSKAQGLTRLIQSLEEADSADQALALFRLGTWYEIQGVRGKSIEYYNQAVANGGLNTEKSAQALMRIGKQYEEVHDYSNAVDAYQKLLSISGTDGELDVLENLARLLQKNGQYAAALARRQQQLNRLRSQKQSPSAELLGTLGELSMDEGQYELALSYYRQAANATTDPSWKQRYLLSQALTQVKAHNRGKASRIASEIDPLEPLPNAKAYKDLAAVNYYLGNYREALKYGQIALDTTASEAEDILLEIDLLRLLKNAHEQLQNYKQAVILSQKYLSLQKEYEISQKEIKQQFLKRAVEAEKEEKIIRDFMDQQRQSKSRLIQERMERDKKDTELKLREQEVQMLKNEERLRSAEMEKQQLERQKIEQQLRIAEQQAFAAEQKRKADRQSLLANERRLQAEKSEAERARQQRALEVVKKEKALQETQLEQEKSKQMFSYIMLVLATFTVVIAVSGFRASRKAQRNLQAKSAEIGRQNQALKQTQQELQEKQSAIQEKNKAMEMQQEVIQSSLNYALNIQGAILPSKMAFKDLFEEHFIFFKPKDVVSGDFYWLERLPDGSRLIATIDCTGHGIPGAFMSMIGHTLMNEILITEGRHSPADLLEALHYKTRQALHQDETKNRDGMDCCVCWLPSAKGEEEQTVVYAGARIPLYYSLPDEGFQFVRGTKRSLGGEQMTEKEFEEHELKVPKGTILYLTTDGIIDQSNPERKRFGKARLRDLIIEVESFPLNKQCEKIDAALADFQGEESQRDDITMIGVRL